MPIITPTKPPINSTFNVTPSALALIQTKMSKAAEMCNSIFKAEETWEALFETNHIFHEFDHFIVVIAHVKLYNDYFLNIL